MKSLNDKVALITGASAGIGAALAREYAARGAKVVVLARRLDRLEALSAELGHDRCLALACDVNVPTELQAAVESAVVRFGGVDIVIANAGFGVDGALETLSLDDFRRQFETNVFAVVSTAQASFGALRARRGVFCAVGSVAGYLPTPGSIAYNMSKAAVRSMCETLSAEWARAGVSVVHVAPGFVESEIRRVDRNGFFKASRKDPVPKIFVMPTERAAREIVEGIDNRRPEVVLTRHGRLGVAMSRLAPRTVRTIFRVVGTRLPSRKAK